MNSNKKQSCFAQNSKTDRTEIEMNCQRIFEDNKDD